MGDDARRVITLLTDFGWSDPFVGMMKGVILGINPEAVLIDLCHGAVPYDPLQAGFLLATSYRYFPKGTIHVAVVDPGVGGPRRPIVAECDGHLFVGPDNGLFGPLEDKGGPLRVRIITAAQYFLHPVSATFHGRDVFAPVAAHLSLGADPAAFGEPIGDYVRVSLPRPSRAGAFSIRGEILHVERFGNLVTNIGRTDLETLAAGDPVTALLVEAVDRSIPVVDHYGQVATGAPGAIVGSADYLEIFVREGHAARILALGHGSSVTVSRAMA
jgi:S-adenosylmethionine hydrolase